MAEFLVDVYEELLGWPSVEQLRYVRGFVDGEGGPRFYFHKAKNSLKMYPNIRSVVISNTDKRLLVTIQRILQKVKIESKLYVDELAGEDKATKDSFVLMILKRDSLQAFSQLIGFTNPGKAETLRRITGSYRRRQNS